MKKIIKNLLNNKMIQKTKLFLVSLTKLLSPLLSKLKPFQQKAIVDFKKATVGEEELNKVLLKWGLTGILAFWFIFRDWDFVLTNWLVMVYFVWLLYAIMKCSPKLTKEEKAAKKSKKKITKEEKTELKKEKNKELLQKIALQKPWHELNWKRVTIAISIYVLLEMMARILDLL